MTPVELLFEEILNLESQYYLENISRIDLRKKRLELLEKAKEMEKQQIEKSWIDGKEDTNYGHHISLDAENYYNKTYKNTNK